MKKLTSRQQLFLDFLAKHYANHGYWPSIRDIQDHFQLKSTNGVLGHLRALERKKYISRVPGTARAYHLTKPGSAPVKSAPIHEPASIPFAMENMLEIPIYGSIAAGYPDGVESSGVVAKLQIDAETARVRRKDGIFALRVRGESMVNAGIFDGDTVILEQAQPRDGDIVAALIDGQTTLKRYIQKRNQTPFLKAENPSFPNIYPITELIIQGVARSIVRSLA
ncbi:MAG: transcriptional repressor LexA [Puniceicoccales bacterium]|nr:transcriptional repressor LexA [Puniceicoccales bacterium]